MGNTPDHIMVHPNRKAIRQLWQTLGSTQKEMAEAAGIHPWTRIKSMFSTAQRLVRLEDVEAISNAFSIPLGDLYENGTAKKKSVLMREHGHAQTKHLNEANRKRKSRNTREDQLKEIQDLSYNLAEKIENLRMTSSAARSYRELVSLFSDKPLTHAEAMVALKDLVRKVKKFETLQTILKDA